ncbi:Cdc37 [Penicillium chermesinum]|nr:Cdc37 [Penicillium chermesinum]
MVLDYSKWDALELSDDSDIEVHPNVDKKSFIRAKQAQIHQQREQRRHEIKTLKYERLINDGLLSRIDQLLSNLNASESSSTSPDEVLFKTVMEFASNPAEDQAPTPPEGVYTNEPEQPKFSQMMSSLLDQVKKELDEKKPDNLFKAYIQGVEGHKTKVQNLQTELLTKLAQLEKEEGSKITSDKLHEGFNTSHIMKAEEKGKASATSKQTEVELLNPGASTQSSDQAASNDDDDPANVEVSALARQFVNLKVTEENKYKMYHDFIASHREILKEKETDGLLVEAFNAQIEFVKAKPELDAIKSELRTLNSQPSSKELEETRKKLETRRNEIEAKEKYSRTCVHNGLLLQYCRSLGPDGIQLFFSRIQVKGHRAWEVFTNDVNETHGRIKERAIALSNETSASNDPAGVEQIQLHAVDPNTKITINLPNANSEDPTEIEARKIFDAFPEDLQKALASESLDEVNKVLGAMSVEEAEIIVEKLSEGGMLSLEEGIIDGTTEEGQKKLADLEAEARQEVGAPGGDITELD